ncbi:MAG: MFS transporter [Pyrinomonadaceae bacterium]
MPRGRSRFLNAAFHVLFFLSGIATVLIGQVLPILARRFALDDLHLGYFFQAQFAGSLAGTFSNGWFGRRGRLADAGWIGGMLMGAGILGMNAESYPIVLLAFLVNGFGIGMTLPAINLLILEMNPKRSASALNVLNFCWGVGAIICKPFVDVTAGGTTIALTTTIVSSGSILFAAFVFLLKPKPAIGAAESTADINAVDIPIWTTFAAWAIAAFNLIHVGFESGMGGWLTTYAARLEGSEHIGIFSPTFLFFLCFVIGRAVAPLFFLFLNENKMLLASLAVTLIGMIITIVAKDVLTLSVGSAVAGLGTSSIFPTNVSRFYRIFGSAAMKRATPLFLAGTLGAAVVTYSIGFVSSRYSNLRSGMFVLFFSVVVLIIIQSVLAIKSRS